MNAAKVGASPADEFVVERRRSGPVRVIAIACGAVMLAGALAYYRHSGSQVDYSRVYVIGYEHNPPLQIVLPDGEVRGFAVDTVRAAARRAGIRLRWLQEPNAVGALKDKTVDLWPIFADLPERHSFAHISEPWSLSEMYLITRADSGGPPPPEYTGPISYTGAKLLAQLLARRWPHATAQRADPLELASGFCQGRHHALFVTNQQSTEVLPELNRVCPASVYHLHHLPEFSIRLGVGSTLERAAVGDRLREEIVRMSRDGELGGILSRYSYMGLTEARTILEMTAAERQSHALALALGGLGVAMSLLIWLAWHLRRARQAADLASLAKGEFLANMSHEIRTPLSGMIGMLELALDAPIPPSQRDYLETAQLSARSLLSIINDILDFSRIEARRMELAPIGVDPRELLSDVERLMSPVARSKGLRYFSRVDEGVPECVSLDPVRLKQVLLNLTGNAIKFTECGSVTVSAGLDPEQPGKLRFQVSDTGVGIPADLQEQVFEAFRQADGSIVRKFGGSGLGLAISRQLVNLMGGRIGVDSRMGQGSTFWFTVQAPAGRAEARRHPSAQTPDARSATPLRILVAEDNAVNQKLIGALLSRDGHSTVLVDSGRGVLDALESGQVFDVVILDIQMPEMDGFQAAAAIRAMSDPAVSRLPWLPLLLTPRSATTSFAVTRAWIITSPNRSTARNCARCSACSAPPSRMTPVRPHGPPNRYGPSKRNNAPSN